jgi:solute:Na+ symporter, SSS family
MVQQIWPRVYGKDFPLTSQWLFFYTMMASIAVYVITSLLSRKPAFDLDRMLHHGKYAIADDATNVTETPARGWLALFGMNKDFTVGDRIIYGAITSWTVISAIAFFVVLAYKLIFGISVAAWISFWHFYVWMILFLAIGTTIWFTWGGVIDLKKMFQRLSTLQRDENDNGSIRNETPTTCKSVTTDDLSKAGIVTNNDNNTLC